MGVYCRAGGCWSITLIKLPVSCLCIVGRNWKYTLKTAEEKAWVILLYTKEDTEGKKGCYRAETELWMELMSLVWGQWARRQKINHSLERHSRSVCLWKEQWWWQDWQGAVLHAKLWELVRKLGGGGGAQKMVTNEELEQGEYVSVLSLIPIPDSVTSCLLFLDSL